MNKDHPTKEQWMCLSCNQLNAAYALECGRCDLPRSQNAKVGSEQLVSDPLSAGAARAKCEEAAAVIVERHGGHWYWLDENRLRVHKPNGDAFATLHMEPLQ